MFDKDGNPIKDAEATVDQDQSFAKEIGDLFEDSSDDSNDNSSFQGGLRAVPGGTAADRDDTAAVGGTTLEAGGGEGSNASGSGDGGEVADASGGGGEGGGFAGADGGAAGVPGASEGGVAPGAPGDEADNKGVTEGEGDKAPEAGADPPEVAALKAQVMALTQLVDQLSTGQAKAKPLEAPAQPVAQPPSVNLAEAFKDVDLDDVLESKEKFLDFFSKAAGMIYQQGQQDFMAQIPTTVTQSVQRTMSLQQTVDQFYQSNPELTPVKGYVASVAQGVAAEHPDWEVGQLLEEASKRAKAALKIPSASSTPAAVAPTAPGKKPALPGGTRGAKAPQKQSSSEQDEILDLISD